MARLGLGWRVYGDGRTVPPGEVVPPEERLSWGRTVGIGVQHVLAMFGATFLVPILTGFPPATTLFFSGLGTLLFLLITGNRLPSYLGSSFAFIAPILAAKAQAGPAAALGGVFVTGLLFALVGLLVHRVGVRWIDILMPPVVNGTVVALIGFNLAPAAKDNFEKQPVTALVTLVAVLLATVLFSGILGRMSIFVGVLVGYAAAGVQGQLDFGSVEKAAWVGLPQFTGMALEWSVIPMFVPVVLVLIAENVGHVKAVASMTDRSMDPLIGRAFIGDGVATMLAGAGGGSATTTYGENIGVMAATRVYSTAAYWVAGVAALLLGLSPKFGALINTIPAGVLGGATTALYGLIGIIGARIWVDNKVDFRNPANLMTAAVALIIGIADFTWTIGELSFNGIALGALAAVAVYHVMRLIGERRATLPVEPVGPEAVPKD
jgi:uracil-xanthine permease